MERKALVARFDRTANTYDHTWQRLAPLNDALHLLIASAFERIGKQAHVLVVGAGTGAEILFLAKRFPEWRFTAVEPSSKMVDVLRDRLMVRGLTSRCAVHLGFLDSLHLERELGQEPFDAATSLLVSQFVVDEGQRVAFFRAIAERLRRGAPLVVSDLCGDLKHRDFSRRFELWLSVMSGADVSKETRFRLRKAYAEEVAVLPPERVAGFIEAGGFDEPMQIYQALLMHAFVANRGSAADDGA